jgi:hypothetical protein
VENQDKKLKKQDSTSNLSNNLKKLTLGDKRNSS